MANLAIEQCNNVAMTLNNFLQLLKKKFYLLEQIIFYLLILFLPTQLGKHFWPNFSYISGIRVDYLSPTIYLTDILILFLFASFFASCLKKRFKSENSKEQKYIVKSKNILNLKCKSTIYYLLSTISILVIGALLSKNPWAGFYGVLKFLEFVFLGFYTAGKIKQRKDIEKIAFIFSLGVFFEGALAILQFFNQSSLGGLFYFFGERAFNSQTPGIANASINGQLILRPYATFPHPNVLAGYLTIAMTMVISNFKFLASRRSGPILNFKKFIFLSSLIIGTIALFLTMSRVAIVSWLLIMIYWLIVYIKQLFHKHRFAIVFFLFSIFYFLFAVFYFSLFQERVTSINFSDQSIVARWELTKSSLLMLKDHPFFGVGLNNFLVNLPYYQKLTTQSLFLYLQPVHNIYLLVASQTGIVGLSFFIWFIVKTFKNFKFSRSAGQIIFLVLFLGFFDHYFLTLQQGQLLFSFVLGLGFARIKN